MAMKEEMNNKQIKTDETEIYEDRNTIIVENFFKLLKHKKISAKEYAIRHNIDNSMLSKWKNGTSAMTSVQIYEAARYFNVTINDLYYTEQEKKRITVLFTDSKYDPIQASQTYKLRNFLPVSRHPFLANMIGVVFIICLTLITFFSSSQSVFWVLLCMVIPLIGLFYFASSIPKERTFLIPYLDDIYYKTDSEKIGIFFGRF